MKICSLMCAPPQQLTATAKSSGMYLLNSTHPRQLATVDDADGVIDTWEQAIPGLDVACSKGRGWVQNVVLTLDSFPEV